jgi:hypothetical protein
VSLGKGLERGELKAGAYPGGLGTGGYVPPAKIFEPHKKIFSLENFDLHSILVLDNI